MGAVRVKDQGGLGGPVKGTVGEAASRDDLSGKDRRSKVEKWDWREAWATEPSSGGLARRATLRLDLGKNRDDICQAVRRR